MRRSEIVMEAKSWAGTPYHHQASVKLVGTDCLGLVRGVWRGVVGDEPEVMPPYTPSWAEGVEGSRDLLYACEQHMVPAAEVLLGSVLLFRMARTAPVKHCGICVEPGVMIHARHGKYCMEETIDKVWKRLHVATFDFPGVADG